MGGMIEIEKAAEIVKKSVLRQGVDRYLFIMRRLHGVDVSRDTDFQNAYRDFYQMRRFYSDDFCRHYFKIMQNLKDTKEMTFEMAIERVKHIQGSYEISFSSKMAHTINPLNPIWDSVVTKRHFGICPPYARAKNKERACCDRYDLYLDKFYDYMTTEEGIALVALFDREFPQSGISNVKKIDFILWQDR